MQRVHCLFTGRVQGVGFRATAVAIARRHAVTGSVRNLANGTVELEAQGERAAVDAFLADVADHFAGCIDHMVCQDTAVIPGEAGFRIAY
jgi:acylphosphatase